MGVIVIKDALELKLDPKYMNKMTTPLKNKANEKELLNGDQRRNQIYYGTEIIEDEAASREGSMVGTG